MDNNFLIRTIGRAERISLHAQRIFFSFDIKDDIEERDKIINDLLSYDVDIDCSIAYFDYSHISDRNDLNIIFDSIQLLIFYVSNNRLKSLKIDDDNGMVNWPIEFREAKKRSIPILPILIENNQFDIFNQITLSAMHCISIWYDAYLSGGRDFNKEILSAIDYSDALILVEQPS